MFYDNWFGRALGNIGAARGGDTGGRKQNYSQPGALSPSAAMNKNQGFDWMKFLDSLEKQNQPQDPAAMAMGNQNIYGQIRGGGQLMNLGSMMNPMNKFMGK